MPVPANLVHQLTTGTGTGNLPLTAVPGKQTFAAAFPAGTANEFDYFVSHRTAAEWEYGTAHVTAGALVRDTVIGSSNANAAVNFSAGDKDVTNDIPAAKQVTTDTVQTLSNKTLASPVVTGTADVQQAMVWSGDISPSQITSNQNDYAPTGFSTATVLRLNSDASREITGLSGGADGRIILIHNVGSFGIVLKDESLSSAAGNRFALSADVSLTADASTMLQYDATSSRWRAIGGTGSGSGGAGDALTANPLSQFASTTSAQLAGVLSDETGSAGGGLVVFSNSPVLTTPQINDTSADHQYVFAASELAADRTVTLPLLTGNDEFVFKDHAQTLTNKTLTSPVFTAPAIGAAASGSVIACTGAIAQQVRASYTTYTSTSATIPFDDTIPQNTEGTELMTLAITPKSATNRLRIEFSATFRDGGTSGAMAVALFQDSTTAALQTRPMIFTTADSSQVMYFEYEMAAGTTSATTFKIRYGVNTGSITIYVNGNRTTRQFGATQAAWLTITELTA